MRLQAVLAPLMAFSILACGGNSSSDEGGKKIRRVMVGEQSPTYQIATLAGDSVNTAQLKELTLLNVWATWCTSCKEEFALMDSLKAEFGDSGLRIVAVSVDVGSTEPVRKVIDEYAVTFEVAHDANGEIERAFPALGVPASYLIGSDGVLKWKHVGVIPPSVRSVISESLVFRP